MTDANVVGAINTTDPKFRDVENVRRFDKQNKRRQFLDKLRKVQSEYTAKHKPYDFRSAKADFEFAQEDAWRRGKRGGATREEDVEIDFDFDKYGKADRFKLIDEKPIVENKLIDGIRQPTEVGTHQNYISVTGTRICVQVPIEVPDKTPKAK